MDMQIQSIEPMAKVMAATALSQSLFSVQSVSIWKNRR